MIVEVDPGDPIPVFEQLRAQLAAAIVSGTLEPGERLPPIRRLAADLGIAPGTVQRAYRELERVRLVTAQGRRGTHVSAPEEWVDPEGQAGADVAAAAHSLAVVALQRGLDAAAVHAEVDAALTALSAADPGSADHTPASAASTATL